MLATAVVLTALASPGQRAAAHSSRPPRQLTHFSLPDGTDHCPQYDGAGNQTQLRLANGMQEQWGYDLAGRLTSTSAAVGGTTLFSQTATLDAAGQRTALDDSGGHTTYGYDQDGRLTSAAYPDGSGEADQYDPAGNRTVITGTVGLSTI